ncbi:MAG: CotH kinase family protein [Clostridiales bacterium]|nr:CotH kinase family protein [Clostridiales bacterium]
MKKLTLLLGIAAVGISLVACSPDKGNETPKEDPNGAKITFSAGDGEFTNGNKNTVLTANTAGKVNMTDAPVCDGYAFIGWYNGNVQYNSNTSFKEDCTFTAKYVSGNTDEVYNALFDEQSTVSIDMNMSDAEWKKLSHDYTVNDKSPIYRVADSVTIGIDNGTGMLYYYYKEVGVRMKGNTSRHEFYGDSGFTNNIHMKLSFKQTFDDTADGYTSDEVKPFKDRWKADADAKTVRKNRMLGGMEKIDIKYNSTKDETYVREMYAMKLFRDNGVIAPHVTMCSVTALEKNATKKNMGVYRIHEAIDEAFIARHFDDAEVGDLWKCTYSQKGPADMTNYDLDNRIGVEDELNREFYSYDKKTNKKKDKNTGLRDFSSMRNFIETVSDVDTDASVISQYLDVEQFAKFEAVNYILGNPDCMRNNYNNYYVYFRKSDNKAVIIPYDYDRCLGLTNGWNPTGDACMSLEPYTRRIAADGGASQNNPIYKKLICKGAPTDSGSVLMKYKANLEELSASSKVTAQTFNAYKDKFKSRYGKYTSDAIKTNGLAFDATDTGNTSYSTYINKKLETLRNSINNYN